MPRTTGWQCVAWPGHVIAQHGRRPCADEYRAGRGDLFHGNLRGLEHQFAVLWREPVCQRDSVRNVFHLNQPAVFLECFFDKIGAGESGELSLNLFLYVLDQFV